MAAQPNSIEAPPEGETLDLGAVSQKASDPTSGLTLLFFQNETLWFDGDGVDVSAQNAVSFQPILARPILNKTWNVVARPSLPFVSTPFNDSLSDPLDRTTGIGDARLFTLFAPLDAESGGEAPGIVWGVGPTFVFPTASDDILGEGKYQLGPAAVLYRIAPEFGTGFDSFNLGAIVQQWWSYAGDDDRDSTNNTWVQYFINYRPTAETQIGMQPTIEVDWKAGDGNRLSFPVGLGASITLPIGGVPVLLRAEGRYYVVRPDDFGEDFSFAFVVAPILGV